MAQKEGKFLFLNPEIPDWIVVNENAAYILNLFKNECNISDVIKHISNDLKTNVFSEEIQNIVSAAMRHKILIAKDSKSNRYTIKHEDTKYNHQLKIVHIKMTNACNLNCTYCYADSKEAIKYLSFDRLKFLSKEVKELASRVEYVLSGGEPLLHKKCIEFGEIVKSLGNEVHLLTNGTLINKDNVKRIADIFDLIKISLDGITDQTHSLTRGSGHHNKVLKNIDLLEDNRANVQLAMTVSKLNLHEIPQMVKFFGPKLKFQPLFKAGRGSKLHNLYLTGGEYYHALVSTPGVNPMSAIDRVISRARNRGILKCAIADSEISISENGDVFPCQMLADINFKAGNIHDTNLKDIYSDSLVLKQFRSLTVNKIAGCKECPVRLICGGACRARDYYETGRVDVCGAFCEYEKLAYLNRMFDVCEVN